MFTLFKIIIVKGNPLASSIYSLFKFISWKDLHCFETRADYNAQHHHCSYVEEFVCFIKLLFLISIFKTKRVWSYCLNSFLIHQQTKSVACTWKQKGKFVNYDRQQLWWMFVKGEWKSLLWVTHQIPVCNIDSSLN